MPKGIGTYGTKRGRPPKLGRGGKIVGKKTVKNKKKRKK
jgi:hypothetical protein